jgi:nucleoside-diphosphate-sugar epimerase
VTVRKVVDHPQKMRNLVDFIPAHSDEEGLKELAQWYLDNGWISLKKS